MKTLIDLAWELAQEAHKGQVRKGTNLPYLTHLKGVQKILEELGCSEEVVAAGILHDVIEDGNISLDMIKFKFGERVAEIVEGVTEPIHLARNAETWHIRKSHSIEHFRSINDRDILIVACADKLDNLRSIYQELNYLREAIWGKFRAGKEDQKWYYSSLAEIFLKKAGELGEPLTTLASEIESLVGKIFEQKD